MAISKRPLAIIFSDEHLNIWNRFNENNNRLDYGLKTLKHIKLLSLKYKCVSLFLGDLFHKETGISNELLSYTLPHFKYLWGDNKFQTYAITGNHDQSEKNLINKISPSYINTLSQTFPGLHCMDFKQYDFGEWTISGIPYLTQDIGLLESVEKISIDSKKYNVLMLHTTMPGAKDTNGREVHSNLKLNDFEKAIIKFDLVLCGHIHKPETYKIMTTDVVQVGATKQQRLTDEGCEMGYWILYSNYDLEFIHLSKYPKIISVSSRKKVKDDGNYYIVKGKESKKLSNYNKLDSDFDSEKDMKSLAVNYCKEKGIKSKRKKKALINSLKKRQ